jgi:hypothetical protein
VWLMVAKASQNPVGPVDSRPREELHIRGEVLDTQVGAVPHSRAQAVDTLVEAVDTRTQAVDIRAQGVDTRVGGRRNNQAGRPDSRVLHNSPEDIPVAQEDTPQPPPVEIARGSQQFASWRWT